MFESQRQQIYILRDNLKIKDYSWLAPEKSQPGCRNIKFHQFVLPAKWYYSKFLSGKVSKILNFPISVAEYCGLRSWLCGWPWPGRQHEGGGDPPRPDGNDQIRGRLIPGQQAGHLLRELRHRRPDHHLLRWQEQEGERGLRQDRQVDQAVGGRTAERAEAPGSLHRRGSQSHAEAQGDGGEVRFTPCTVG